MAFDFGTFAGALGQSLMNMNGNQNQPQAQQAQQMPLDMSWLQALFSKPHANDMLPRYDQRGPQRPDPGMQMFMGHSNHLTGGY